VRLTTAAPGIRWSQRPSNHCLTSPRRVSARLIASAARSRADSARSLRVSDCLTHPVSGAHRSLSFCRSFAMSAPRALGAAATIYKNGPRASVQNETRRLSRKIEPEAMTELPAVLFGTGVMLSRGRAHSDAGRRCPYPANREEFQNICRRTRRSRWSTGLPQTNEREVCKRPNRGRSGGEGRCRGWRPNFLAGHRHQPLVGDFTLTPAYGPHIARLCSRLCPVRRRSDCPDEERPALPGTVEVQHLRLLDEGEAHAEEDDSSHAPLRLSRHAARAGAPHDVGWIRLGWRAECTRLHLSPSSFA